MKYKLLCDRCMADRKAFMAYKNGYNNGRCFQCNGHGYILTSDKDKATKSHQAYINTIKRYEDAYSLAKEEHAQAITNLEMQQQAHREANKDLYEQLDELHKDIAIVFAGSDKQAQIELMDKYKQVTEQIKGSKTNLEQEVKDAKREEEKAFKQLETAKKFYEFLQEEVE